MRLERQLLFIDKKSLADYLRGNALNIELHRLYNLYLSNNKDGSLLKKTEIQVLNEVYYQCTWITNLKKNLSPASKANMPYVNSWYKDFVKETQSDDFAEFIACLVVGLFSVMPKRIAIVTAFTQCLQEKFARSLYYNKVCSNLCEFKKLYGAIALDFTPHPVEVEKLAQSLTEWRQVTNSFSHSTLTELIARFSSNNEKLAFIRMAEEKAKEFNARSTVFDFLANTRTYILDEQERIIERENEDMQILGEIGPNGAFLVREYLENPRKDAELTIAKEQLAEAQHNLAEAWRQSEEYKQAASELKEKLGSHSITLDEIADCIMRIPDYHESYNAFKEINTILVGTVWQSKAQDVLKRILEKQGEQQRPVFNIDRYYANGSTHDDKGKYLQIGSKESDNPTHLLTEL